MACRFVGRPIFLLALLGAIPDALALCAFQKFLHCDLTLRTLYAEVLLVRFEEFTRNCYITEKFVLPWVYRMNHTDTLGSCRGRARVGAHVLAKAVGDGLVAS